MLLPILASLVAKVLAVFAPALKIVPALIPVLLEIVATHLALVGSPVPRIVPLENALAPFVVAI
jgi:hypothetical protein